MIVSTGHRWDRVTVVGCGLVGASFALALKRAGVCGRVAGWDVSAPVLAEAVGRGVVDEADEAFARGGVCESDLVYLAMPVGAIIEFLRGRGAQLKPGAVVTDAGSTKGEICRAARESLPRGRRFVGGHPVAGSHLGGPAHARAELFEGAPYVLAVDEGDADENESARAALAGALTRMGARVVLMKAGEHDRAMALVSHAPQLVSSALAAVVRERRDAGALRDVAGRGFADMTRLAASEWSVWRDIVGTNRAEVADALDSLISKLAAVRDELRAHGAGDLERLSMTGSLFEHSQVTGSAFEWSQTTSAVKG